MKGKLVNILGTKGHMVCVEGSQWCHCGTKAAILLNKVLLERSQTGYVPIKLYLKKQDLAHGL